MDQDQVGTVAAARTRDVALADLAVAERLGAWAGRMDRAVGHRQYDRDAMKWSHRRNVSPRVVRHAAEQAAYLLDRGPMIAMEGIASA